MAIVIHLTEVVVHGLDLAVATQKDSMDEGLSEQLLTTMTSMGGMDAFQAPASSDRRSPFPTMPRTPQTAAVAGPKHLASRGRVRQRYSMARDANSHCVDSSRAPALRSRPGCGVKSNMVRTVVLEGDCWIPLRVRMRAK
jgi:hypothetical protein